MRKTILYAFLAAAVFLPQRCIFSPKVRQSVVPSQKFFVTLFPGASERLQINQWTTLSWSSTDRVKASNVRIDLTQDSIPVSTIVEKKPNDGVCGWEVPNHLPAGRNFQIRIRSYSDTSQYDFSETFEIYTKRSGGFEITRPGPNSLWAREEARSIKWISSGSPGNRVCLYLYRGGKPADTLSEYAQNTGNFIWNLPGVLISNSSYRIKITSWEYPVLHAFSDSFSINGYREDKYEPDDTRETAVRITPGQRQVHALIPGNADWLQLSMSQNAVYIIRIESDTTVSRRIYMGSAEGYSASSITWDGQTLFTPAQTAEYFIRLENTSGAGSEACTVWVIEHFPKEDGRFSSPGPGTVLTSGTIHDIRWAPDSVLFGPEPVLLLYENGSFSGTIAAKTGRDSTHVWAVYWAHRTGDDFRIRLAPDRYSPIYSESPVFSIGAVGADEFEPDSTRETGAELVSGIPQLRSLPEGDIDYVWFHGEADSTYIFRDSGIVNLWKMIYADSGIYLSSFNTMKPATVWKAWETGTYYLKMSRLSGTSTEGAFYSISISRPDPDHLVRFLEPADTSVWTGGENADIQWEPDALLLGDSISLTLSHPEWGAYSISSGTDNDGGFTWAIPSKLMSGTGYKVIIAAKTGASLRAFSPPFSIKAVEPDPWDPDSYLILFPGSDPVRRVMSTGDVDPFSFECGNGRNLKVRILANIVLNASLHWARNDDILYNRSGGQHVIERHCSVDDVYSLFVMQSYPSNFFEEYTVEMTQTSSDTLLKFSRPGHDTVWASDSAYTIQWAPDSALYPDGVRIRLDKGFGNSPAITFREISPGTVSWIMEPDLPTGNDYRISLYNPEYTMAARSPVFSYMGMDTDRFEPDNSASSADILDTSWTAEGHTISSGNPDWFRFGAERYQHYLIETGGGSRIGTTLFGADTASDLGNANLDGALTDFSGNWLSQGEREYYIRVTGKTTGRYRIRIRVRNVLDFNLPVTEPHRGDSFISGDTISVGWTTASQEDSGYAISLMRAAGDTLETRTLAGTETGCRWSVAPEYGTGEDFYFLVVSAGAESRFGKSGVFAITQ